LKFKLLVFQWYFINISFFFFIRSISVGGVNCFDLYPFTFFDFSTLVANSNGKFSRNGAIYKVLFWFFS